MIPIVVFGAEGFVKQLEQQLSLFCTVSKMNMLTMNFDVKTDIYMVQGSNQEQLYLSKGIVVADRNSSIPQKCDCSVFLTDSARTELPYLSERTRCITCGMHTRDSVSFSGLEKHTASVSFLREIIDLNDEAIEPFELPIHSEKGLESYDPFLLLCLATLCVLIGKKQEHINLY